MNDGVPLDLQYRDRAPLQSSEGKSPCLVLMHGYGSNELDLLGLGDVLDPKLHIVSLRAPISMGNQAYAWFDLDWDASGPVPNEDQALVARDSVIEFLITVPGRFGVAENFTIGGFSQGAMMALGITLADPSVASRLIMMSGRVLSKFVPEVQDQRLSGVKALVQHGLSDEVLGYQGSRQAAELLRGYGAEVRHIEYPMRHEISQRSLGDIWNWMAEG